MKVRNIFLTFPEAVSRTSGDDSGALLMCLCDLSTYLRV